MRFVVVGAGATGGFLGALLTRAGEDVTLVARGPHLEAMARDGLRVRDHSGEWSAPVRCQADLDVVAAADVVLLTVKAHSIAAIAPRLGALLTPGSALVTAQNGLPWWYFQKHGGSLEGTVLSSLDPDGILTRALPVPSLVGAVVWPATRMLEPGLIEHVEGTRFTIGELDGERSARCGEISAALNRAGLRCRINKRIRSELWLKLLGNVAMNPLSALTRATLVRIASFPATRQVAQRMMEEAAEVAAALGVEMDLTIEQRLNAAELVGEHHSSMLQDLEMGRPLEVEALIGAVVELGQLVSVPVPTLSIVYACVKLLDQAPR
jgi:2-dehydropantoate 2-reductase